MNIKLYMNTVDSMDNILMQLCIYQSNSIVFSEAPSQTGARNLKLIASSLMKLASLSEARVRFKIVCFCLTFNNE